jgi:hypothetical protein
MGNFIKSVVEIVALAAKAVFVSLTTPATVTTPIPTVAELPTPAAVISQPCTNPNRIHIFETENGQVIIFSDSRSIIL